MRTGIVWAFIVATMMAGCMGSDSDEGPSAVGMNNERGTPATNETVAGEPSPPEMVPDLIPFSGALNGRLEPGVRVCQPSTGVCNEVRPTADDQELFISDLTGTMEAGRATLTWEPASDLTRELRLTVFWVPACEGCDLVFIGGEIAEGPITAEFEVPMELDGGSIWAYARAPYANSAGDVYVQNDFEQDFTLEVEGLLRPPSVV